MQRSISARMALRLQVKAGISELSDIGVRRQGGKMPLHAGGTSDGISVLLLAETNRVGATCHHD